MKSFRSEGVAPKLAILCLSVFAMLFCTAGSCIPVNPVDQEIQQAIDTINEQSASWQSTLQTLVNQLIQGEQQTIANQVTNLLNEGIAAAGAEVMCDEAFIATQVKNGLLSILHDLDPSVAAPVIAPALCAVVPATVDMNDPPPVITFYGYNFDATGERLSTTFTHDGTTADASQYMTISTPYLVTVNISQTNGLPLCNLQNRSLVLEWGATPLSTVAFVAATCAQGYWKAGPGPQELGNPVEFSMNGFQNNGSYNFTAGSVCDPGYQQSAIQFDIASTSGDCEIRGWSSTTVTDCHVNLHMGVSLFNSVTCDLTIMETGLPVWVPPPPCNCQ